MRALIIEDDQGIRECLSSGLSAESFAVDSAEDGELGSYLARTNDYDIIVMDNILPKKVGADICREIRKSGKQAPIIMLSVCAEPTEKVELLDCGADDYLAKPFSFAELSARIRALLRRPRSVLPQVLTIADLSLDTRGCVAERGSQQVYLTRKEFCLLEYLMKNAGTVLSRGMILEHVWDRFGDMFSNTVETHILNLRRKIDRSFPQKLIHTVPGRGYVLEARQ